MVIKTVYCIRHGLALHNKLYETMGSSAYTTFRDTHLLEEGYNQARHLGLNWEKINEIELVVVSPLSRTIETSQMIFGDSYKKTIIKDTVLEYPLGGDEIANKRKNRDELKLLFGFNNISFELELNEYEWPRERESISDLDNRIVDFLEWVGKLKEDKIALVCHNSFLSRFIFGKIDVTDSNIDHCKPICIEIEYDECGNYVTHILNYNY